MKKAFKNLLFAAASAVFLSGCVTNPDTGAVELFGLVPVEPALEVAEAAAESASGSGGLLGVLGCAAGALFGIWRRAKEKNALKTAQAIADGTSAVLDKLDAVKAENGGSVPAISREEAIELLKKIQNDAGVRESVKKLLQSRNQS